MDERLRELERAWVTSGAPRDGVALVAARVQAGLVTQDALALAARLGHPLVPEGTAPAKLEPLAFTGAGAAMGLVGAAFLVPAGGAPPRLRALADVLERHTGAPPEIEVSQLRALAAGELDPQILRPPPLALHQPGGSLVTMAAQEAAQGEWRNAVVVTVRMISTRASRVTNPAVFSGGEAAWLGRRLAGHLLLDALPPPERWVAPPLAQGPRPSPGPSEATTSP